MLYILQLNVLVHIR